MSYGRLPVVTRFACCKQSCKASVENVVKSGSGCLRTEQCVVGMTTVSGTQLLGGDACDAECVLLCHRMCLPSGRKRLGSRMHLLCEQAEHTGIFS